MKISKIFLCLSLIFICSSSVAFGFVIGSSNLGIMGTYQSFTDKYIFKPSKPFQKDEYSIRKYKNDVNEYVEQAKEYIKAANNDIERIEEAKQNAINDANEVVEEYNKFIKYGY